MTTLTPRFETVHLYQGDDLAHLNELAENVTSAINQGDGAQPVGAEPPAKVAAREYDAFVTEAKERAVKVAVQPLPRRQWRDLLDGHPARMVTVTETGDDGKEHEVEHVHEDDEVVGFNVESIAEPLTKAATVIDGAFTGEDDRDEFIDSLPDPEFSRVFSAAVRLNMQGGGAPKADLSSRIDRIIGETSISPDPSD